MRMCAIVQLCNKSEEEVRRIRGRENRPRQSLLFERKMVGTTGFEPATSRTPSVRATRLRHVPTATFRVSPAFQKGQERAQSVAQIEQHFAAQELPRAVFHAGAARLFGGPAIAFAQMAARTGDGKPFVVQQPLDAPDHFDVFAAIHAVPRGGLHRLQHRKLRLPVAQDEGLRVGQAADLADAKQFLLRNLGMAVCWHDSPAGNPASILCGFQRVSTCGLFVSPGAAAPLLEPLQKPNGRAGEVKAGAELVLEKTLVAEMQALRLVGEENKRGRGRRGLRDVKDFNASSSGRSPAFEVHLGQPAVQFARGDAPLPRLGYAVNPFVEFVRAFAGLRRHKYHRRVAEELQLGADQFLVILQQLPGIKRTRGRVRAGYSFLFDGLALPGLLPCRAPLGLFGGFARRHDREVPLVHHHDDGAARLFRVAGNGGVARGDAERRVYHQQGDVGALQALPRHDHSQLLGDELGLALPPYPRGIHEAIFLAAVNHAGIHGVARRARLGRNNGALFAGQAVEQSGFADVGTPDNGHLHRLRGCLTGSLARYGGPQRFKRRVEQIVHTRAMLGGKREHGFTKPVKHGSLRFLLRRVHFIGGDEQRLPGLPQQSRKLLIERRHALARVHNQNQQPGLINGHARLAEDLARNGRLLIGDDAAGVHDLRGSPVPAYRAVDAVARDARLVGDDGAPRPRQPVEERGFAHVRTPGNHNGWKWFRHNSIQYRIACDRGLDPYYLSEEKVHSSARNLARR